MNEVNCSESGAAKRSVFNRFVKTACSCGQEMIIEHDAGRTCRADGKRIFYSHDDDSGMCAFRCRNCRMPVNETVPGAEYGISKAF